MGLKKKTKAGKKGFMEKQNKKNDTKHMDCQQKALQNSLT